MDTRKRGASLSLVLIMMCLDPFVAEGSQNCTASGTTSNSIHGIIGQLGEIGNNLEAIANKLSTLHLLGTNSTYPATSCQEIYNSKLNVQSGNYWLKDSNGAAVGVYCDMTLTCKGVGRGWRRVANLDSSDVNQQCPPDTILSNFVPIRVCGINSFGAACSSASFSVQGVSYSQVCGKITGYQQGLTDAFAILPGQQVTIDSAYVDGVSLTHGSNPRNHIWTFASARDEVAQFPHTVCPCTNTAVSASAIQPPSFVGNDYFCDTGSTNSAHLNPGMFFLDDPLWDGAGCGPSDTCCSLNNPPWFLKQLPAATTDDIEMRLCRDQHQTDEKIHVETVELYVR